MASASAKDRRVGQCALSASVEDYGLAKSFLNDRSDRIVETFGFSAIIKVVQRLKSRAAPARGSRRAKV